MTDLEIFAALHMMMDEDVWVAQSVILQSVAPVHLCEIGAGNGDWAIGAATMSDALDVTLIDDFAIAMSPPYFWPKTSAELLDHCRQTSLGGRAQYRVLDKLPDDTFDVIRLAARWDIAEVREAMVWIVKHLAPEGVVFVDHLSGTMVPNRFLALVEQIQAKALRPFWFGGNQGGFCHWDDDCNAIQQRLLTGQGVSYRARLRLLDDQAIVQTKRPGVWMQQFAWS